jgi:hypothetical protein
MLVIVINGIAFLLPSHAVAVLIAIKCTGVDF